MDFDEAITRLKAEARVLNSISEVAPLNNELMETLALSAHWILQYMEKNNIPLYNIERLESSLKRARELMERMRPHIEFLNGINHGDDNGT